MQLKYTNTNTVLCHGSAAQPASAVHTFTSYISKIMWLSRKRTEKSKKDGQQSGVTPGRGEIDCASSVWNRNDWWKIRYSLQTMTGIQRLIWTHYLLFLLTQDPGDAKANSQAAAIKQIKGSTYPPWDLSYINCHPMLWKEEASNYNYVQQTFWWNNNRK